MDFSGMLNRVMRAVRLDVSFYNEAEADASLDTEALLVVIIVSVFAGIGSLLGGLLIGNLASALIGLVVGVVWGVVGYFVMSYVIWFVGTRIMGGTAEPGELRRTLGYALAPQALGVFGFIPCVGPLAALAGFLWSLVCIVVAVRESLDTTTGNAVITAIIGWLIIAVGSLLIATVLGIGAWGLGALTGAFN
jgi:hypothetical protein